MEQLKGVGVAIVTPFAEDGSIDYRGLERLINHQINGGVDYLVLQGTTGESVTVNQSEKQALLAFMHESIRGRVPLVFGHGGSNTQALIDGLEAYDWSKVDAILSVSPYYSKPSEEGIFQHFMALAEAAPKPILLYNVPGRTGSNMSADLTLRLAHGSENIIGVKEASGDLSQLAHVLKSRPDGFLVLSGDDDLVWPQIALGADGVISVIANAFPKQFSALVQACRSGDIDTARRYHFQLMDIIPLLFQEGNPGGIKAVLNMMGICGEFVRSPLVPVSESTREALYRAISEAGIPLN